MHRLNLCIDVFPPLECPLSEIHCKQGQQYSGGSRNQGGVVLFRGEYLHAKCAENLYLA